MLALGSHVRGERLRIGAYGVNCSVSNLSSEGPAPVDWTVEASVG